jgi:hypothetical protein
MLNKREFDLLQPCPQLQTQTGEGCGLAACPSLGVLVTSDQDKNTLSVWSIPECGQGGGLKLVCTLGGAESAAPMQFHFKVPGLSTSGYLAFTTAASDGSSHPLLVVADGGNDAVHIVDVVGRTHAGYVAAPGTIAGPRGVAASASTTSSALVAVSAWKEHGSGDHVVILYKSNSGTEWEVERIIGGGFGRPGTRDGQLQWPFGLRFNRDGSVICVADHWNDRVSVFRVGDGGFVRHIPTQRTYPADVEELEGGWLVAYVASNSVQFVGDSDDSDGDGRGGCGRHSLGKAGGGYGVGDGEFYWPAALATVPGLGLVVRDSGNERLQVFATPDTIAMLTNMSGIRIAWMSAVARAVISRRGHWCRW